VEDKVNGRDLHDMVWCGLACPGQTLPPALKFDRALLFGREYCSRISNVTSDICSYWLYINIYLAKNSTTTLYRECIMHSGRHSAGSFETDNCHTCVCVCVCVCVCEQKPSGAERGK